MFDILMEYNKILSNIFVTEYFGKVKIRNM